MLVSSVVVRPASLGPFLAYNKNISKYRSDILRHVTGVLFMWLCEQQETESDTYLISLAAA